VRRALRGVAAVALCMAWLTPALAGPREGPGAGEIEPDEETLRELFAVEEVLRDMEVIENLEVLDDLPVFMEDYDEEDHTGRTGGGPPAGGSAGGAGLKR
jgi:hypothetical protein